MPVSLHEMTIPVMARALRNGVVVLDKTIAWAQTRQASTPASLSIEAGIVHGRLAPDMFPFARQIQIATDIAKGCAARLGGLEVPKYEDTESTFAELRARYEKTIAFVESVDRVVVENAAGNQITLKTGGRDLTLSTANYVNHYVFPNLYFHLTMAYALARQAGVGIGKGDFLGAIG